MEDLITEGQQEQQTIDDIPEIVRIFCSGRICNAWSERNTRKRNGSDQVCGGGNGVDVAYCTGFDYKAATDFLRQNPDQVRYVTYEGNPKGTKHNNTGHRDNSYKEEQSRDRRNKFLHSPLRWACIETTWEEEAMEFLRTVRDIDPSQFLLQDSHGVLPIEGECVLNASLPMISFLLEIYLDYDFVCPNGVGMTEANFNPITCLCGSYWWEDIHEAHKEILSGERTVSGKNVTEDNLGIEDSFWQKILLFTKAFYHKTIQEEDESSATASAAAAGPVSSQSSTPSMLRISNEYGERTVEFRLLHACAGIDWFPPNLLRLLVVAFPDALTERDEDGNLPIHVAAGGRFDSYKIDATWEGGFDANSGYQKSTIDILLEANPVVATIADKDGRLPLDLAIESESSGTVRYSQHRWRPWEDGGIDSLLRSYPEAARIRNPVTGKLPLETALTRGCYRDWDDGIRALLEAYPEAAGLRNPLDGKSPLQLAIEKEMHFDKGIYGLIEASPEVIQMPLPGCSSSSSSVVPSGREGYETRNNADKPSSTTRQLLPLFAFAAAESCSASVVYKLLRTCPETCYCFAPRKNDENNKRKHHEGAEKTLATTAAATSCYSPLKKRWKSLR
mmetsp:Transcript_23815/g.50639  ORF Transcript_23815/g.50639 Transcript_23815/m.50639 type:complete len:618 (-) Transcript_23815:659-2512(-)